MKKLKALHSPGLWIQMAENLTGLCSCWAKAIQDESRWGSQETKTLLTALSKGKIWKMRIKCTQASSAVLHGCVGCHREEMKCSSDLGEGDKAAGMVLLDLSWVPSLSPDNHGWCQTAWWQNTPSVRSPLTQSWICSSLGKKGELIVITNKSFTAVWHASQGHNARRDCLCSFFLHSRQEYHIILPPKYTHLHP